MKRFIMYLYALFNCLYIFTVGYLFKKNRKYVSNMCELFGFQKFKEWLDPDIRTTIPKIEIAQAVNDAVPVQLCEASWTDGNISLLELTVIAKIVRQYKPKKIFEIGTFNGRTTLNLACNSPENATVYTLDLPEKKSFPGKSNGLVADVSFVNKAKTGSMFHKTQYANKIVQLFGDSAAFDFSPYHNSIDFVFIDGAHTYGYILNDTDKAFKLLNNGCGLILWHDYSWVWADVARALNKLYATNGKLKDIKHIKGTSLVYYRNAD